MPRQRAVKLGGRSAGVHSAHLVQLGGRALKTVNFSRSDQLLAPDVCISKRSVWLSAVLGRQVGAWVVCVCDETDLRAMTRVTEVRVRRWSHIKNDSGQLSWTVTKTI